MKKNRNLFLQIFCWLALLLYEICGLLIGHGNFQDIALTVSIIIVGMVAFYICYLFVLPKCFFKKNKMVCLAGGILMAFAAFTGFRYLIEEVIYFRLFGFHNYNVHTTVGYYIFDNIYYSSSYIIAAIAVWAFRHNYEVDKANKKLKEEAVKAELAFLKSQINPHFLYNTLNYIYALALPVSDKLAHAVIQLSGLMRYTIDNNAAEKVRLKEETDYLKSYIELFRMRFENNFFVHYTIKGVEEQKIPSLLLIPFVENAFKHGVSNNAAHPVRINLEVRNNILYFEVINAISKTHTDHSSGIGMANIRRRLELIYPDAYQLDILNDGKIYTVKLVINLVPQSFIVN